MIRGTTPISELRIVDLPSSRFSEHGRILIDGGISPVATLSVTLDLAQCEVPSALREAIESGTSFEALSVEARDAIIRILKCHLPSATEIRLDDKFFTISLLAGIPLMHGPETTVRDIKEFAAGMEDIIANLLTPWSVDGEPYLYEEAALIVLGQR